LDFAILRAELDAAPGPRDRPTIGRPPVDPIQEFRMLVLQAMRALTLAQTGFPVSDRPRWMRFGRARPRRRRAGREHLVGQPRGLDRGGGAGRAHSRASTGPITGERRRTQPVRAQPRTHISIDRRHGVDRRA